MSTGDNWAETHGYTHPCMQCGTACDMDFCSASCKADYIRQCDDEKAALAAELEAEEILPGDWEAEGWPGQEEPDEDDMNRYLDSLP